MKITNILMILFCMGMVFVLLSLRLDHYRFVQAGIVGCFVLLSYAVIYLYEILKAIKEADQHAEYRHLQKRTWNLYDKVSASKKYDQECAGKEAEDECRW